jgi:pyrimidine-specific ribonucleoside hydrolase
MTGTSPRISLIHVTDLYHPPQDPDDHFDLVTVVALEELHLAGVILDATRRFLEGAPAGQDLPRDPGLVPVAQLGYLSGRSICAAVGPIDPLRDPWDGAADRSPREQGGIALLCRLLRASRAGVLISVVGSARVVTAAFNREPDLLRRKVRAILLNAGSLSGAVSEWNVDLDRAAFVGLWRSGLPIDWYPCATENGAFDPEHRHGTFWKASHDELLRGIAPGLLSWFRYGLTGSPRGDVLRVLSEEGPEEIPPGERNLWSTASLVMAARRTLAETELGWRFVPQKDAVGLRQWSMALRPISASVKEGGEVVWRFSRRPTGYRLFLRDPGSEYGRAMSGALHGLLCSLRC